MIFSTQLPRVGDRIARMLTSKRAALGVVAIGAILAGCGTTKVIENSSGSSSGGSSSSAATIKFGAAVEIPLGVAQTSTQKLVVADINGDGFVDLFALTADGSVSVAKNAGGGSFASFTHVAGGGLDAMIAVADVNADGRADVLMTLLSDDSLRVTLGTPDGTAPTTKTIVALTEAGQAPVIAADLDGDGLPEALICAQHEVYVVALDGRIPATTTTLHTNYNGLCVAADLDENGRPDLIVPDLGDGVSVWLTDASGKFPALSTIVQDRGFMDSVKWVSVADFNNDGHPDLVSFLSTDELAIRLTGADGSIGAPTKIASRASQSLGNTPAVVADVNGDGNQDIVALVAGDAHTIAILLGDGSGSFTQTEVDPNIPAGTYAVTAGDFDGDGLVDIAIGGADRVWVLRNTSQ